MFWWRKQWLIGGRWHTNLSIVNDIQEFSQKVLTGLEGSCSVAYPKHVLLVGRADLSTTRARCWRGLGVGAAVSVIAPGFALVLLESARAS